MKRVKKRKHAHYLLPLFILASALVFGVVFAIVLMPSVVSRFGYEPVIILLLMTTGTVSAMLALLFYLLLKGEIKL